MDREERYRDAVGDGRGFGEPLTIEPYSYADLDLALAYSVHGVRQQAGRDDDSVRLFVKIKAVGVRGWIEAGPHDFAFVAADGALFESVGFNDHISMDSVELGPGEEASGELMFLVPPDTVTDSAPSEIEHGSRQMRMPLIDLAVRPPQGVPSSRSPGKGTWEGCVMFSHVAEEAGSRPRRRRIRVAAAGVFHRFTLAADTNVALVLHSDGCRDTGSCSPFPEANSRQLGRGVGSVPRQPRVPASDVICSG